MKQSVEFPTDYKETRKHGKLKHGIIRYLIEIPPVCLCYIYVYVYVYV